VNWLRKCLLYLPFLRASKVGPLPTSPSSSALSTKSFTPAPNTTARAEVSKPKSKSAPPKSYPETKAKTPNVSAKPIIPKAIVLHHSGGSYAGGVAWIKNPASRVSYHCLVAPDGKRTVFANPEQRTWHAGVSSYRGKRDLNSWSVGAAFSGDTYKEPLTDAAMASMAEYLEPLMRRYRLTLADVTDHRTVSPGRKDDLKPSELTRFRTYLAAALAG
jgi:N-acetyl-anhydromuramyl-L-alanine amidase AmpD